MVHVGLPPQGVECSISCLSTVDRQGLFGRWYPVAPPSQSCSSNVCIASRLKLHHGRSKPNDGNQLRLKCRKKYEACGR